LTLNRVEGIHNISGNTIDSEAVDSCLNLKDVNLTIQKKKEKLKIIWNFVITTIGKKQEVII
jgi:hypothetical protein